MPSSTPKRRRTFRGCLTCRQRKVKCGEETPYCANCERLGLVCQGYQCPLKWVQVDPSEFDARGTTRTLVGSRSDSNVGRRTVYSFDYRRRMARELAIQFSDGDVNAELSQALKELDERAEDVEDVLDSNKTARIGPFGVFNTDSSKYMESAQLLSPSSSPAREISHVSSEEPRIEAGETQPEQIGGLNLSRLFVHQTTAITPSRPIELSSADVPLDEYEDYSMGNGGSAVNEPSEPPFETPTIDISSFDTGPVYHATSELIALNTHQSCVVEQNHVIPAEFDSIEPARIRFLFNHYLSNLMHLLSPVYSREHPFRTFILDRAMAAYGALTLMGDSRKTSVTTFNGLLTLAASHVGSVYRHYTHLPSNSGLLSQPSVPSPEGSSIAQYYSKLTQASISSILVSSESQTFDRSDWENMLMTLINLSITSVVTGSLSDTYSNLKTSMHLLDRLRGVGVRSTETSHVLIYTLSYFCILSSTVYDKTWADLPNRSWTLLWQSTESSGSHMGSDRRFGQIFGIAPKVIQMIMETTFLADEMEEVSSSSLDNAWDEGFAARRAQLESRIFSWPSQEQEQAAGSSEIAQEDGHGDTDHETDRNGQGTEYDGDGNSTSYEDDGDEPSSNDGTLDDTAAEGSTTCALRFSDLDQLRQSAINLKLHACVSKAMYSGLVIYFLRRVSHLHPAVLQQYVDDIITQIDRHSQLRREYQIDVGLIFWPAFVAGCEAMDKRKRRRCLEALQRVELCGFRAASNAISLMKLVWDKRDRGDMKISWIECAKEARMATTFL